MNASLVSEYLGKVAAHIRRDHASGVISRDWFTDGYWNENNWLHGYICGRLTTSVAEMGRRWIAIPESSIALSGKEVAGEAKGRFRPDLLIVENEDMGDTEFSEHWTAGVVEFESTNSSDARVPIKDFMHTLRRLETYAVDARPDEHTERLPAFWIVLTCLSNEECKRLPWHAYNRTDAESKQSSAARRRQRDANPYKHFAGTFSAAHDETWRAIKEQLPERHKEMAFVWANIGTQGLSVERINGASSTAGPWPILAHP